MTALVASLCLLCLPPPFALVSAPRLRPLTCAASSLEHSEPILLRNDGRGDELEGMQSTKSEAADAQRSHARATTSDQATATTQTKKKHIANVELLKRKKNNAKGRLEINTEFQRSSAELGWASALRDRSRDLMSTSASSKLTLIMSSRSCK